MADNMFSIDPGGFSDLTNPSVSPEEGSGSSGSPREILLSVEDSLSGLHQMLSRGLSAIWEGEACDAHRTQEEELYRDAREALAQMRQLL